MSIIRRIKKLFTRIRNRDPNDNTEHSNGAGITYNDGLERRLCQVCRLPDHDVYAIRRFDYHRLPTSHFHPPDHIVASLMEDVPYPDSWIHLPYDKELTRYNTRCCYLCYMTLNDLGLDAWNYWDFLSACGKAQTEAGTEAKDVVDDEVDIDA